MDADEIARRQDAIENLIQNPMSADSIREELSDVHDVERLLSRIAYDAVTARECLAISATLEAIPTLKSFENTFAAPLLRELFAALDPIEELADKLKRGVADDPPASVRDAGVIREGYSPELDELRGRARSRGRLLKRNGAGRARAYRNQKFENNYNRVFGYYIEVTKSFYEMVPG